ncbi:amidohydrolase family protein [Mycobacterium yunnanensis]|uniref:Amidohydrolase family protein n=1 Tax=Mycobacterium yunnanensis TaxID=368477 RepID=A0A9X2YSD5_9MYCO|nr:amidohydrolase family protein [Mycobacterium yunnanensis]MCV7424603.1 amidohydrolase family protein [Mycobacterium yunnanensis]
MLIRHATVLSLDPAIGEVYDADVLVDGARVTAVGRGLQAPGHDVLDATGCVVIPGFVDTHRHMWEGGLRGLLSAETLDWYFQRVLMGIAPALTPDDLAVAVTLSARAALGSGITTVLDFADVLGDPARTDAVVAALQDTGLRVRFSYGVARAWSAEHGGALPAADVRRVRSTLLADDDALVTMGLAPVVADDAAERHNAALADELGLGIAYHVRDEITPSRLLRLGALRPGTTFIHGNGLSRAELTTIADHGGSLSMAPVVEMVLGLGNPMIVEGLTVPGLPLNLSCDVDAAGPTDMFSQMRTLYLVARAASTDTPLTPRDVLEFATLGGARALGMDATTGSITPGKQADLVVLRADEASAGPLVDPYGAIVLQMDRSHVDAVMVAGVLHRRVPGADHALLSAAAATIDRLRGAGVVASPSGTPAGRR